MNRSDQQAPATGRPPISRRRLLSWGALSAVGVLAGEELVRARAAFPDAVELSTYQDPRSGDSVQYPSRWSLDTSGDPDLILPHHSFAIASLSGLAYEPEDGTVDLSGYGTDGIVLWVLSYDELLGDGVSFRPPLSLADLSEEPSEFDAYSKYRALLNGSRQSFLMRLWIGVKIPADDRALLDATLASFSVP